MGDTEPSPIRFVALERLSSSLVASSAPMPVLPPLPASPAQPTVGTLQGYQCYVESSHKETMQLKLKVHQLEQQLQAVQPSQLAATNERLQKALDVANERLLQAAAMEEQLQASLQLAREKAELSEESHAERVRLLRESLRQVEEQRAQLLQELRSRPAGDSAGKVSEQEAKIASQRKTLEGLFASLKASKERMNEITAKFDAKVADLTAKFEARARSTPASSAESRRRISELEGENKLLREANETAVRQLEQVSGDLVKEQERANASDANRRHVESFHRKVSPAIRAALQGTDVSLAIQHISQSLAELVLKAAPEYATKAGVSAPPPLGASTRLSASSAPSLASSVSSTASVARPLMSRASGVAVPLPPTRSIVLPPRPLSLRSNNVELNAYTGKRRPSVLPPGHFIMS